MELKLENILLYIVAACLLIVPYGIETSFIDVSTYSRVLLIVPYGIETFSLDICVQNLSTFNRTLWN